MTKIMLAILLAVAAGMSAWAWQESTIDFCTPSHLHNRCGCLAQGGYLNCKDGKRTIETQVCLKYCDMANCQCCKSIKR